MLSEIFPFGTLTDLASPLAIKNKIGCLDNHKRLRDNQELWQGRTNFILYMRLLLLGEVVVLFYAQNKVRLEK